MTFSTLSYTPGSGLPLAVPPGNAPASLSAQVSAEFAHLRGTNTPPQLSSELSPELARPRTRRRVDADVLARLAEVMPERDREVLERIAEHRYLTTHQVQAFVFTMLGSEESAARTTRRVLHRLTRNALLRVTHQRIGGARMGSAARVYQLAPAGARLVRDNGHSKRTHEPSLRFLAHCLAVADVHLAARQLGGLDAVTGIDVETEPDCWRRYQGVGGEPRWLQPDLALSVTTASYIDRWFIEVDLGSESLPTVLRKCGQYEAYRASGSEQDDDRSFPLVLWMMTDPDRLERLCTAVLRSPRLTPELYRYATPDTLRSVLQEPLS